MNTKETKKNIILAGQKAVDELIKVAEEPIVDERLNENPKEAKEEKAFRGFAEGRSR